MSNEIINLPLDEIIIAPDQRWVRPWKVLEIVESYEDHGYNASFPITVEKENGQYILIDGGHRLEAARRHGLESLPCILKPEDVSRIRHSLNCNSDQTKGTPDDVFDLAERAWQLDQGGWEGEQIAKELGWNETASVTNYKNIKTKLCSQSWELARTGNIANSASDTLANYQLANANWLESHFRAFLKHLPYDDTCAMMRAQVRAIRDIIARANEKDKRFGQTQKKVTAAWISKLAQKYAWHTKLALYMRDHLVERVPISHRVGLLRNTYQNVYGERETEESLKKFEEAVANLNEKALGVTLYHDDALQRLPLLDDKSINLVITDSPYNVTEYEWDKIGTDEEYLEFTRQWLELVRPKLADDYHAFVFCDPSYQARIERLLVSEEWPIKSRIIWHNRSVTSGRPAGNCFAQTWQMVFHCGTHKLNWSPKWDDGRFDVQVYAAPNANTKDGGWHPTPKPVKLLEHFVELGSKDGDTILDMFAGGGATGAASSNVGRRQCILVEKYDEFCKNIEKRLDILRKKE